MIIDRNIGRHGLSHPCHASDRKSRVYNDHHGSQRCNHAGPAL